MKPRYGILIIYGKLVRVINGIPGFDKFVTIAVWKHA